MSTPLDDAAVREAARKAAEALVGTPMRHALLALALIMSHALTRVREDRREEVTEALFTVILGLHDLDLPPFERPEEPLQ